MQSSHCAQLSASESKRRQQVADHHGAVEGLCCTGGVSCFVDLAIGFDLIGHLYEPLVLIDRFSTTDYFERYPTLLSSVSFPHSTHRSISHRSLFQINDQQRKREVIGTCCDCVFVLSHFMEPFIPNAIASLFSEKFMFRSPSFLSLSPSLDNLKNDHFGIFLIFAVFIHTFFF